MTTQVNPALTTPLALTPGEPAGIGPDITLALANTANTIPWVAFASIELLRARAKLLDLKISFHQYQPDQPVCSGNGNITVQDVSLSTACMPGIGNPQNADYVLKTLTIASQACMRDEFSGLVTAPVHKGLINQAGFTFSGHTEFLANISHTPKVIMMLASPRLRVALLTTHVPLSDVASYITASNLKQTIAIIDEALRQRYNISQPKIAVCGLNPHAGDDGAIGQEEQETIIPCLQQLKSEGYDVSGPIAADTLFVPSHSQHYDVILAMYHDQGLPVIKAFDFGDTVNITLGLPFIRTSVDHGTAFALAGTSKAKANSLVSALQEAARQSRILEHSHA